MIIKNMKKLLVIIFCLFTLIFIGASCEPIQINPTLKNYCCVVSDSTSGDVIGCSSSEGTNLECDERYSSLGNTQFLNGKCSDVSSCNALTNCFGNISDLGIIINMQDGGYQCYSGTSYLCDMGSIVPAEDCSASGKTCNELTGQCESDIPCSAIDASQYCISNDGGDTDDWIERVQFGSIDVTSGVDGVDGYEDLTSNIARVNAGNSYDLSLTIGQGNGWTQCGKVWVDWNQNKDLSDDISYDMGCCSSNGCTLTKTITVPNDAVLGATLMRVSEKYDTAPNSCEIIDYGEVEDYTLCVQAGCYADDDCSSGQSCVNGVCCNIECSSDSDCDALTPICSNAGTCSSKCLECSSDSDCDAGEICTITKTCSSATPIDPSGYCVSSGNGGEGWLEQMWVDERLAGGYKTRIATIESGANEISPSEYYYDGTQNIIGLKTGKIYEINVDFRPWKSYTGPCDRVMTTIWIDWNDDKIFTSDERECGGPTSASSWDAPNGAVTVTEIESTTPGTHLMRIRGSIDLGLCNDPLPLTDCANLDSGKWTYVEACNNQNTGYPIGEFETEDYTLSFTENINTGDSCIMNAGVNQVGLPTQIIVPDGELTCLYEDGNLDDYNQYICNNGNLELFRDCNEIDPVLMRYGCTFRCWDEGISCDYENGGLDSNCVKIE